MAQRETIRVLVADDMPEARAVLRHVIETDERFEVVAEAATGLEAVEALDISRPHVVVLDVAMPELGGLDTIPILLERAPETRILVVSSSPEQGTAEEVMRRGGHDYLAKSDGMVELVSRLEGLFPDLPPARALPSAPARPQDEPEDLTPQMKLVDILSLLVHELQSPLAVVEGFSIALVSAVERGDDAAILETSEAVRRATKSLRALIRSFAEVGALEAGRLSLNLRDVAMAKLIQLTLDDLATGTASHAIDLDVREELTVRLDSIRIRQVITNLITNAVKFSPRNSTITIAVRRDDEFAYVAVSDRGPGIPEARQAELFRKFSRLGATSAGTGLGLYLSRGIARGHGGNLVCDSAPGRGSTFTLSLPLGGPERTSPA